MCAAEGHRGRRHPICPVLYLPRPWDILHSREHLQLSDEADQQLQPIERRSAGSGFILYPHGLSDHPRHKEKKQAFDCIYFVPCRLLFLYKGAQELSLSVGFCLHRKVSSSANLTPHGYRGFASKQTRNRGTNIWCRGSLLRTPHRLFPVAFWFPGSRPHRSHGNYRSR